MRRERASFSIGVRLSSPGPWLAEARYFSTAAVVNLRYSGLIGRGVTYTSAAGFPWGLPSRTDINGDKPPLDFVCEEDVRLAIQSGRKLVIAERAIVTPAARDLGEANRVFSIEPWRGRIS